MNRKSNFRYYRGFLLIRENDCIKIYYDNEDNYVKTVESKKYKTAKIKVDEIINKNKGCIYEKN